MVSFYQREYVSDHKALFEVRCLSTDTKPTKMGNTDLANGSALIEIDTLTVFMYDEDSKTWKTAEE